MELSEPDHAPLSAVVLAAGMSRRMGSPKGLLDLEGKSVILHVVQTMRQVLRAEAIFVVTGHEPHRMQEALAGQNVRFAHNPEYDAGQMLSSVKVGAAAVRGTCEAFLLATLDQPLVLPTTLQSLRDTWQANPAPLMVPCYQGKRGHPILIAANCIDEILAIPADGSLRDFVERRKSEGREIAVKDRAVVSDLDTPEDYQRMLGELKAKGSSDPSQKS